MNNTENIKEMILHKYLNDDFTIDKTGSKTIELIGTSFIADAESMYGDPNLKYVHMELNWYTSKSLNVYDLEKVPQIWKNVADKDGNINSNYGWCIYSSDNGSQYSNVTRELKKNKNSRRASMIYTRPTMHTDYNINGMSDFMCTNNVDYFIRDEKLHCVVKMRSNDLRFGYNNDLAWQQHVLSELRFDLLGTYPELTTGQIIWQASSLHLYERDFDLIEVPE